VSWWRENKITFKHAAEATARNQQNVAMSNADPEPSEKEIDDKCAVL